MKVDDFQHWVPNDGHRYESVDGIPRVLTYNSPIQGPLVSELGAPIGNHLRKQGSAREVTGRI